jgi:hypothetical protein
MSEIAIFLLPLIQKRVDDDGLTKKKITPVQGFLSRVGSERLRRQWMLYILDQHVRKCINYFFYSD